MISDTTAPGEPDWMQRALALARRGLETTTPNPCVGCVLVRDGRMVGEGWHERAGEPHAEVHALRMAGDAARGSTAYVTLEPCSHTGRTGPCCEALIAAGVSRVVVAMQDPNPLVAGRGLARLGAAGVAVRLGPGAAEAAALNRGFVSRMTRGRPFVLLKCGMSLDGRTALANGASQWITGAAARADVHRLRAESCAVLTGIGTVLADDPLLTVRGRDCKRQPRRLVVDPRLDIAPGARLLAEADAWILTLGDAAADPHRAARRQALAGRGIRILDVPAALDDPRHLDLAALLRLLGQEQINEVLVEAGAGLNGALLAAGVVDECVFYVAPSLLGDGARGPARVGPLETLDARLRLRFTGIAHLGDDLRITAIPLH